MSDEPLFTMKVYEDLTIETDGGMASDLVLAGLAVWAMELIIKGSQDWKDREHAQRVIDEIKRCPYDN